MDVVRGRPVRPLLNENRPVRRIAPLRRPGVSLGYRLATFGLLLLLGYWD